MINFFELHAKSNFSFLQGASHPEELVKRAIDLKYSGLAITDECSMAGIVRAYVALKKQKAHNFKLIIGSSLKVDFKQNDHHQKIQLVLLCPDKQAYAELCQLITRARRRSAKGEYQVKINDLSLYLSRCLAIFIPTESQQQNEQQLTALKQHFKSRIWIGYQRLLQQNDYASYMQILALSVQFELPIVAQNHILMHDKKRLKLLHCLTAIAHNKPVQSLGQTLNSNAEQHLRTLTRLNQLYPLKLLAETQVIAELCQFTLDQIRYEYPSEVLPANISATQYLKKLVFQGAKKRWPNGIPEKFTQQIKVELDAIAALTYEHYFLTVYDIVQFARAQNILCQGRGSAANSIVCYCLFITEVNPEQASLLFERFISKERNEPPDIDIDFEHQRREEVIQYIYKKYSRDRAALTATVITYRVKSAIRDVGKALRIDQAILNYLTKSLAWWDKVDSLKSYIQQNHQLDNTIIEHFYQLVKEILGFPRHLSQHVGGFIITQSSLTSIVPVENASMPDRTIIQWDKYDIEALSLLKVDILGLGMLSMIQRCLHMVKNYSSIQSLADIPKEDPATYQMICQADTIGVFQIESRAQMSMLPRLRPQSFYDLVIQIAIVRPGPIQGNMVHPYLKRRNGETLPQYPNKEIEAVLQRTLGVPIFQEQVIKLAMVAAGFTGGEADQLRRAMATWGRNGDLYQFKEKLIVGMFKKGYSNEFSDRLFEQMKGFGSYGFPESHSASFAILAYFSAWFKRHHPAAFYCALLNSQPMGFYSVSQLIQDARRHQIVVLPVDIDSSNWQSSLVTVIPQKIFHLRLGMHLIKGFNQQAAKRITQLRQIKKFTCLQDLTNRAGLNQQERQALIQANALPRLAKNRYQAQWNNLAIEPIRPLLPIETPYTHAALAPPTTTDNLLADYQSLGLTLNIHPIALLREQKKLARCHLAKDLYQLRHGQFVQVAGLVTGRQRPGTATGVIFMTVEDETGNMNIIIWNSTLANFRAAILNSQIIQIKGKIERKKNVVHIIAGHLEDISHYLPNFNKKSRDFH
ncbi:error-prone DNA polymerase [Aliikangiella maris]|uniref:Error-prone DNA polymerase n=2 Tax=Aliikangiella maris TaxID=3162458 RepID=A0ABV2BU69_9GAMM